MAVRVQIAARRHFDGMKEERWGPLAATQHGMLSQRQLNALEVSRATVRSQLRAGRWSQRTSSVFSTTTGPLAWEQRLWCAILHAGPDALIGGLTAAKVHGMRGWERDEITVLVGNELSFEDLAGVRFFRTRRSLTDMHAPTVLPLCQVAPAVLLFAGYEANLRTAHGALAAVVQQRLTDVPELASWLERLRPIRGAGGFRLYSTTSVTARSRSPRSTFVARVADAGSASPMPSVPDSTAVDEDGSPTPNGAWPTGARWCWKSMGRFTTTYSRRLPIGPATASSLRLTGSWSAARPTSFATTPPA